MTKLFSNLHSYFLSMYAIVDIETTGGPAYNCGITEVAILIFDGEKIVSRYEQLIHPERSIPSFITSLTGIDDEMVSKAPIFDDVAEKIATLLNGNIFVAHNVNFDFTYLQYKLKKAGYLLDVKRLCTVRLARKIFPGFASYSLGKLCNRLGIRIENRHRAGGDATATVELFHQLLLNGADVEINKMLKRNSSEHWLPLQLEKNDITSLPEQPGVYYFHDRFGKVIYIGKAINIRKRVTSHFTGFNESNKRQLFLRDIYKITYRVCVGELHALITESMEIKKKWPKHNKSQKQPRLQYGLYAFEDNRGHTRLSIQKKLKHLPPIHLYNTFEEGRGALRQLNETHELNPYLCFLEPRPPEEWPAVEQYNYKVQDAIKTLEEQLPTYAVLEPSADGQQNCCLLIEKGVFKGVVMLHGQIPDLPSLKNMIEPGEDNDFIRKSIASYAQLYTDRVVKFCKT